MFCRHYPVSAATRCGWVQAILPIHQGTMAKTTWSHIAVAHQLVDSHIYFSLQQRTYTNNPLHDILGWWVGYQMEGSSLVSFTLVLLVLKYIISPPCIKSFSLPSWLTTTFLLMTHSHNMYAVLLVWF